MSINVSAINVYKDELSFGLASKILLELETLKFVDVLENINGSIQLNNVASTMYGVNAQCNFTDTGSTVFAGNVLTLQSVNFYNDICGMQLNDYWMGKMGADTDSLGQVEEMILAEKASAVAKELEKQIWQGSESSPSYAAVTGNLTLVDGFLQKAYELSASTVNVSKTAITASNAIVVVDTIHNSLITNLPDIVDAQDLRLFLSPSDFSAYMQALRNADYRNFDTNSEGVTEILHPGSIGLKVTKVNGLSGAASGTGILTYGANMVFGCKKDPSALASDLWFSKDERKLKYAFESKFGVQFVFAEQVIKIA